ncbi:hypothetical protein Pmar_PMAR022987 [Perkinsus marinus ATCC 50983]|uniref:Uncharacterized protein n=1 Tax=Perkinsus marinus (strain ATCC 50983 / TXsc) TaxID=423536 RepID=C5LHT6_PERM5|nr:hypothetical protein Pmar_PMAR022987 [Perkinsus marinus ATCC 50983]EER03690.1 hypothetical protein Pmar_PMAR022987 [Perkinsus marinus ATCC 50983]|eukprot:XP_002771874.1 hypothetical protein Pmar_PMAR022987 [Perkinsus marinus ATCC 50983]
MGSSSVATEERVVVKDYRQLPVELETGPVGDGPFRKIKVFTVAAHNMIDQIAQLLTMYKLIEKAYFYDFGPYCEFAKFISCWSPFRNDGLDPPRSPMEKAALDRAEKLPGARGGKKHHVTEFTPEEKMKYYEILRGRPEFRSSEAFLCIFPPGPLCRLMLAMEEAHLASRKKLIMLPGWRFDQNFKLANDSCNWSNDLRRLFVERKEEGVAALGEGPEGAISLFDVHHIHHFIGVPITEIPLIDTCVNPLWLGRSNRVLEPDRASKGLVLFFPARKNYPDRFDPNNYIYKRILKPVVGDILMKVRKVYPRFEVEDLVRHKAVVWVPYAPTICALVEQYSAGITIFVPSLTYLVDLVLNASDKKFPTMYDTITGRECYAEGWRAEEAGDPYPPGHMLTNEEAAKYWLNYSFFYTRPFFHYFDSPEDLQVKLEAFSLGEARENSWRIRHYFRMSEESRRIVEYQPNTAVPQLSIQSHALGEPTRPVVGWVAQAWPSPVGEYPPESIGAGPGGGGGVAVDAVIEGTTASPPAAAKKRRKIVMNGRRMMDLGDQLV